MWLLSLIQCFDSFRIPFLYLIDDSLLQMDMTTIWMDTWNLYQSKLKFGELDKRNFAGKMFSLQKKVI